MASTPSPDLRAGDEASPSIASRSALRLDRSRQREQWLLDAAESVIAEVGRDGFSMREVGRRAQTPIASIYHYFPTASAIVRALAARQLEHVGALLTRLLDEGTSANGGLDLAQTASKMIDALADYLAQVPAAPAIWIALRSNPELRAIDRADTIAMARKLVPHLASLGGSSTANELEALGVVLQETVAVNLMIVLELAPEARARHVAALKVSVGAALGALQQARTVGQSQHSQRTF